MVFIETTVFTRQIRNLVSDEHLGNLQEWIATSPTAGTVIKGSGGCRKLRWNIAGKGKRGGIRVIYFWLKDRNLVYLLLAYAKSSSDDLSQAQIRMLSEVVKSELK